MLVSGNTKVYEQPKGGLYEGVLADIIDLGMVQGNYGIKPRVRLIWILNATDKEGNFFRVQKSYNAVLHEKSNLYADVRDMLGATPPIPYELDNFLGKNFQLVIVPAVKKDGTPCVNVKAILSPKPGQSFTIPADFVRNKDRQNKPANNTGATNPPANTAAPAAKAAAPALAPQAPPPEVADEDIPF